MKPIKCTQNVLFTLFWVYLCKYTFGTTIHNLELGSYSIKRKFEGRWGSIKVPKPKSIAEYYNSKMADIDLVDQANAFVGTGIKQRFNRWPSRVNAGFFENCRANTRALFMHYCSMRTRGQCPPPVWFSRSSAPNFAPSTPMEKRTA